MIIHNVGHHNICCDHQSFVFVQLWIHGFLVWLYSAEWSLSSTDRMHISVKEPTWWRHQMETFSALLAICAGNSPVPGEFPAQRPVTRSFDVFFDMRLNKRLSKQWWGWWFETLLRPLWCQCNAIQNILYCFIEEYRSLFYSSFSCMPSAVTVTSTSVKNGGVADFGPKSHHMQIFDDCRY